MTILEIVLASALVIETIILVIVVYSFFKLRKVLTSMVFDSGAKALNMLAEKFIEQPPSGVMDISQVLDQMMSDRHNQEKTAGRKERVNPQLRTILEDLESEIKPERDQALKNYKAKDGDEFKK